MKVNFEYTKEEYKKYLLKGRLVSNIVLFVIVEMEFVRETFSGEFL